MSTTDTMPPELRAYLLLRAAIQKQCDETTRQVLRWIAETIEDKEAVKLVRRTLETIQGHQRRWFKQQAW